MRKRIYLCIAALVLMFAAAVGFTACGGQTTGGSDGFLLAEGANMVWLDRYEEADVVLASGDSASLDWKSSDESIVTVQSGLLIAQGEGETTVTVSDGNKTETITVRVRDSGIKPRFSFDEADAFLGESVSFPNTITYNDKIYTPELEFEISFADDSYASFENGKITGMKLGSTTATVSAPYKGITLEKTIAINVKEPLNIVVESSEVEIYNVEGKFGEAELVARAMYLGEEVSGAKITYSAVSGADCVTIDGSTVKAEKEGAAVIQASYSDGDTTATAQISVTILPNYVETTYENVSFHDITWKEYDGEIGGRTGVIEYKAGADITPDTCFDHRVAEAHAGDKLLTLYAQGYRYFTYDLYYTSNQNLMIGTGPFTSWISVGDFFRKDYFKIISDGKVTNILEKDTWMTMVYDLKALWMSDIGMTADFFFFVNDATTSQYITDVRFYMDDAFIPSENLVYEDCGDYVQATNDEFDVMIPVSRNYSMDTGLPSTVVNPGEAPEYGEYGGTVGGRNGAYVYRTNISDGWKNSLIVATSMNQTYDDSMYALNSRGSYLTFDIYPEEADTLIFRINHLSDTATIKVGSTNLGQFDGWLYVIRDGKIQNTIEAGVWQTVCLAYSDNYREDCVGGSITFSAETSGSVIFIDDVRYRKTSDFLPEEFAEETYAPVLDNAAQNVSLERVTAGEFKGAYKYENGTGSADAENGLTFKNLLNSDGTAGEFFTDGYQYIRMQLYLSDSVSSIVLNVSGDGLEAYRKEIRPGEAFDGIPVFTQDERQTKTISAGVWYDFYIPVSCQGSVSAEADVRLVAVGSGSTPAALYLKNVSFEVSVQTPYLREGTGGVSLELLTSGEFKGAWKYVNRTSGEEVGEGQNWGESGVLFSRVTQPDGSGPAAFFNEGYHWIKVDIYAAENISSLSVRSTADRNYNSYWEREVSVGTSLYNFSLYLFDASGDRANRFERNTWYTLYIPVDYSSLDIGYVYIMLYSNGGSSAAPSVMYLKNIEYLENFTVPDLVIPDGTPIVRDTADYIDYVTVEEQTSGHFEGSYKYTNTSGGQDESGSKPNYGESGVYFWNVVNPNTGEAGAFFTQGYKWLKVPVYIESGAESISIRVSAQWNLTQYWPQNIPVGEEFSPEILGQAYICDADGVRVSLIETGVWYDIFIPVDYTDTEVGIAYVCIYSNGGTAEEPSVMYIKKAEFLKTFDVPEYPAEEPADPSVGNLYVRDDQKDKASVVKDEEGVWTYTNKSGGLKDANPTYGETGVFFMEVSAGSFDYRLVRTEIKIGENVSSITLRFGELTMGQSYWVEEIMVGEALPARTIYLYDESGNMAESLERGVWYTLYVPVDLASLNSIQANGGSEAAPAVIYLKNIRYVNEISETSSYVFGDTVTQDSGMKKFVSSGTERMYVNGVSRGGVSTEFESTGEFFRAGFHVVKMDVMFSDNASSLTFVFGGNANGGQTSEYTFTVGSGAIGNAKILDADGRAVATIESGVWYSVFVYLDYTQTTGWTDFYATLGGGSADAAAVLYVKDAEFMKEFPAEEPQTKEGNLFVRDDYADRASVVKGEDGVWTYTNRTSGIKEGNSQNWGEAGVFFTEVTGDGTGGEFFEEGYRLIRMEIKIGENVSSITLRFGASTSSSYWIEEIMVGAALPGRTIYLYDESGNMAESLERGVWYVLYIPVEDATALNSLLSNGGGETAPAVMYLKNITYVNQISETSSYVFGDTVTQDTDAKKFTSSGEEKMFVNGVTRSNVNTAFESTGEFFRAGFHVVRMQVRFAENVSAMTFTFAGDVNDWSQAVSSVTVGGGISGTAAVFDESGAAVETIERGVWYTVCVSLDYTQTTGWSEFAVTLSGGTADAPAVIYVGEVEFLKQMPQ